MKECVKCHKITDDFGKNGNRLHSWCRSCVKAYNLSKYEETRNYIFSLKTKCSRCGYDKNPTALEFHHPNDDKELSISRYTRHPFCKHTKELIDKEAAKCEILCANCHREEHNPQHNR